MAAAAEEAAEEWLSAEMMPQQPGAAIEVRDEESQEKPRKLRRKTIWSRVQWDAEKNLHTLVLALKKVVPIVLANNT